MRAQAGDFVSARLKSHCSSEERMFNLGMPELIVIFIVALLIFGPKKLPELGKSLGRAIGEFKRTSQELRDSLETEIETDKIKEDLLKEQKEIQESLSEAKSPYPEVQEQAEKKDAVKADTDTKDAVKADTGNKDEEKKVGDA